MANKETEILPYVSDKNAKTISLATSIINKTADVVARIAVLVEKADLSKDRVKNTLNILDAEGDVEFLRALLTTARLSLQAAKIDRQADVTNAKAIDTSFIATGHSTMITALAGDDATIASGHAAADESVAENRMSGQANAVGQTTAAEASAIRGVGAANSWRIRHVAEKQAVATITSKLIHLLGTP